jgi:hypothetical protein
MQIILSPRNNAPLDSEVAEASFGDLNLSNSKSLVSYVCVYGGVCACGVYIVLHVSRKI